MSARDLPPGLTACRHRQGGGQGMSAATRAARVRHGRGRRRKAAFIFRRELFACSGDGMLDRGLGGMDAPLNLPAGSVRAFNDEALYGTPFAAPSIIFRDGLL